MEFLSKGHVTTEKLVRSIFLVCLFCCCIFSKGYNCSHLTASGVGVVGDFLSHEFSVLNILGKKQYSFRQMCRILLDTAVCARRASTSVWLLAHSLSGCFSEEGLLLTETSYYSGPLDSHNGVEWSDTTAVIVGAWRLVLLLPNLRLCFLVWHIWDIAFSWRFEKSDPEEPKMAQYGNKISCTWYDSYLTTALIRHLLPTPNSIQSPWDHWFTYFSSPNNMNSTSFILWWQCSFFLSLIPRWAVLLLWQVELLGWENDAAFSFFCTSQPLLFHKISAK